MSDLITADRVAVTLGAQEVLKNVSLTLSSGEIVTVVGPNGSGKTTLVRALLGAIELDGGAIRRGPNLRIGYVPQKLTVDRSLPMTVDRFLSLPHKVARADRERALHLAGVSQTGQRPLTALSGGQLQRVLLARALLSKPTLLLLDEATQGLDQPGAAAFYRQIETVRDETGCAILMVSHDLHVVMRASDRVICLNGHVCCSGTPASVASAPEYRELFGDGVASTLALYHHQHDHHHHAHGDDETSHGDCAHD